MLRLLAIFLLLLGATAQAQQSPQSARPTQTKSTTIKNQSIHDQRGTDQFPLAVKIIPTQQSQSEIEQDRNQKLQQAANEQQLTVFTGLLVLVGFLQFVAISVQAVFLWLAFRVGKDAANAATRSATAAENAIVKLERAFVAVGGFPWLWHHDTDRSGKFWYSIHPLIENRGNTPTKDMRIVVNSALRDSELPDNFEFPYSSEPGPSFIPPNGNMSGGERILLDDDLLAVQRGEKFFYIWGKIEYRDIFDGTPTHTTLFCTQISKVLGNPLDPTTPHDPKATSVEIHFRFFPKNSLAD